MSKKLVIPTLETQQKYPLFYAEATKTINDIIEHISKERGVYTSSIEPDPKEHLIWFNTNFNIIYFYDEKTKSFLPMTGGGGNLSTIITLIDDLRNEVGNRDNWNNEEQYNTIYEALDGLQTQIQNINSTIIPVYTVSNKNELFDIDFNWGVYKIEEYDKNNHIKHFYILTVGGRPSTKTYKLYGSNGIFIETTINGVKQFEKLSFSDSRIGEDRQLDFTSTDGTIMGYIEVIDTLLGAQGLTTEDTDVYSEIVKLRTLLTTLNNIVGEGSWNLSNFPNGDNLSACVDDLGNAVGSIEDWTNVNKDGNIIEALDRIDTTLKDIQQRLTNIETIINN